MGVDARVDDQSLEEFALLNLIPCLLPELLCPEPFAEFGAAAEEPEPLGEVEAAEVG